MNKILSIGVTLIVVVTIAFFGVRAYRDREVAPPTPANPASTTYSIDGTPVTLGGAVRAFGNELVTDLNSDGRDDVVFLVTDESGGSGTFFYVVAALSTDEGYIGSDGYLLGDRIAPQTTELSRNPEHKQVIVVNYADRAEGEPMTTQPSIGRSVYLKLDTDTMQWGIVEPDFSGEADPSRMSLGMKTWAWQGARYNDGREIVPARADNFTLTFGTDGTFSATTDCNTAGGSYVANDDTLTFKDIFATEMYCEGSQEATFLQVLADTNTYHFTGRGELVFDLVNVAGSTTFR